MAVTVAHDPFDIFWWKQDAVKLTPIERTILTRGQHDGEKAFPPQSRQYTGRHREIYGRGYGRGYSMRYLDDAARKQHGNKIGPMASPDVEIGPRRGSDASQYQRSDRSRVHLFTMLCGSDPQDFPWWAFI